MTTTETRYSLLATLRGLIPKRPLYYSEALRLTELQANALRRELGLDTAELPDEAIDTIPRVRVIEIEGLPSSGTSQWAGGAWIIAVDANEPWQRKRFSTAHELWHIINYTTEQWLCTEGPFRTPTQKRELLADYFAGCLLMPKRHLKVLVGQRYPVDVIADTFGVSEPAVRFRLAQLGLATPRPRCAELAPTATLLKGWRNTRPATPDEVAA